MEGSQAEKGGERGRPTGQEKALEGGRMGIGIKLAPLGGPVPGREGEDGAGARLERSLYSKLRESDHWGCCWILGAERRLQCREGWTGAGGAGCQGQR